MASNTHALSLASASSQYVSIVNASALRPTTNFTIEAIIRTTTSASQMVFESYQQNGNPAGYQLSINASGNVVFLSGKNTGLSQGTDYQYVQSTIAVNDGLDHHIAGKWDGSNLYVIIDGLNVYSVAWANAPAYHASNKVCIGANNYTGSTIIDYFNGQIDEVRLWSEARTTAQIRDNMFRDVTGDTNLVELWKLNNNLTSASGSNDGTGVNTPTFTTTVAFPTYTALSPLELVNTTLFNDANLVSYYKLEDTADSKGSNTLTNIGSTTFASAKFNNGAELGTSNTTKWLKTTARIFDGGSYSFGGWIKVNTEIASGFYSLIAQGSNNTNKVTCGIRYDYNSGTRRIQAWRYNGSLATASYTLTMGTSDRLFVYCTYDGSTIRLYINGLCVATASQSGNGAGTFDEGFFIGVGTDGSTQPASINIDDVPVFNDTLTATEIFNHYTGLNPAGSSSVSPSISPSASVSPSSSVSLSVSPSSSQSPSSSVSLSVSPSASQSPSSSTSLSISPSSSVSASVSPSPSAGYSEYTRGNYAVLPTTTNDLETTYSAQDELDVATINSVYVSQSALQEYMIHQFKDFLASATFCTVECQGKSDLAGSSSTIYLQVYNYNTASWETIDSDNTVSANVDFVLTADILDTTNYKNGSNVVTCRVYQLAI